MTDRREDDNMDDIPERRRTGVVEQHFGTLLTTLILVSILWVGSTLVTQGTEQTKMAGTINVMNVEINHLKTLLANASANNYTQQDAELQLSPIHIQLKTLEEHFHECRSNYHRLEQRIEEKHGRGST